MKARGKSSKGKSAAEEPEPEPDDASPSTAATKSKAATIKTKGKDDGGGHRCANCDKPGATKKCGRCGVEWYCDRNCFKVRGR